MYTDKYSFTVYIGIGDIFIRYPQYSMLESSIRINIFLVSISILSTYNNKNSSIIMIIIFFFDTYDTIFIVLLFNRPDIEIKR